MLPAIVETLECRRLLTGGADPYEDYLDARNLAQADYEETVRITKENFEIDMGLLDLELYALNQQANDAYNAELKAASEEFAKSSKTAGDGYRSDIEIADGNYADAFFEAMDAYNDAIDQANSAWDLAAFGASIAYGTAMIGPNQTYSTTVSTALGV